MTPSVRERLSRRRLVETQRYWSDAEDPKWRANSHWSDSPSFADEGEWRAVGELHYELFEQLARMADPDSRRGIVVEWGCGGGTNALAFGRRAEKVFGIDVSPQSLDECSRKMSDLPGCEFVPLLIESAHPEQALEVLPTADLFVCLFVTELVPDKAYCERIVRIAFEALRPGGLCFIQTLCKRPRRMVDELRAMKHRLRYRDSLYELTPFRVEEFWSLAENAGFRGVACHVKSDMGHLGGPYAYFLLQKP